MKKDDKFVKLVAKKFIERKKEEILKAIAFLFLGIFIPYLFGGFTMLLFGKESYSSITSYHWLEGFIIFWVLGIGLIFLLLLIGVLIYSLYQALKIWIESNIEEAIKEAKKELK